jgi:hypothetical protein
MLGQQRLMPHDGFLHNHSFPLFFLHVFPVLLKAIFFLQTLCTVVFRFLLFFGSLFSSVSWFGIVESMIGLWVRARSGRVCFMFLAGCVTMFFFSPGFGTGWAGFA